MGRTACTEPQCLYKGALYLYLLRNWAVGRGTELQAGRWHGRFPMGTLGFFIDVILFGATQALTETRTRGISWGVKATGA